MKYEKYVVEENNSAKRVSELEAEVLWLQTRVSNAELTLSTSQEAYREIASALDKQEHEYEKKLKLAVEFKPIMENLLRESVKMIVEALQKIPIISYMESQLTPFITFQAQISTAP